MSSTLSSRIGHCALCFALIAMSFSGQLSAQNSSGQWVLSEKSNSSDFDSSDAAEQEANDSSVSKVTDVEVANPVPTVTDNPLPPPALELSDEVAETEQPDSAEQGDELSDEPVELDQDDELVGSADEEELIVEDVEAQPAARQTTISNAQLRQDLDQAFSALSEALQIEDSFSPALGEHYYAYGSLLLQAGQFDDARDAFVDALHIAKINNGIYSLEQRPALKALFETHYAMGEAEESENFLRRIMWIETKVGGVTDDFTYDLLVRMGNGYIDEFLSRPVAGEVGLSLLQKANLFLNYAIDRHGHVPLSEKLLPFGELALVNMLQSTLMHKLNQSIALDPIRSQQRRQEEREAQKKYEYLSKSFSRGDLYLRQYLKKAEAEGNSKEITNAFLNLGDLSLLFERWQAADQYYQMAWAEAQNLPADDELVQSMKLPQELPAFNYALPRGYIEGKRPTKLVPMTFTIRDNGRIDQIIPINKGEANYPLYSKVKRAAKKLVFRPPIVDGEAMPSRLEDHGVRIKLSKAKSKPKSRTRRAS